MGKKTLFVKILDQQGKKTSVAKAIEQVARAFGAIIVDAAVDEKDIEADIAIVDSVQAALHLMKETESTLIILAPHAIRNGEMAEAEAFASRMKDRVKAVHLILPINGPPLIPFLVQLIGGTAEVQP